MVANWGVEAGFGGPVRSLRPLLLAYGPLSPPKGPAENGGPLGGAEGSVCQKERPQRPDRTAKTGPDPPFCHHPCRSYRQEVATSRSPGLAFPQRLGILGLWKRRYTRRLTI